jgi:hypothetical protein
MGEKVGKILVACNVVSFGKFKMYILSKCYSAKKIMQSDRSDLVNLYATCT